MVKVIGDQSSILNQFLAEIRDSEIQKDNYRFRANIKRCAEIIAYEISKELAYEMSEIQTPLGISKTPVLSDNIVIASILRAAIPMHNGMLDIFDKSGNSFIAAYRKYTDDNEFEIQLEYLSSPNLDDKILILNDTMLATGYSIEIAYRNLLKHGTPKHTFISTIIASTEGIEYIKRKLSLDKVSIFAGAVDSELTVKSYIVPGLGDAGDLAFGKKN
jgi:uracil phosphoribosyltransferase